MAWKLIKHWQKLKPRYPELLVGSQTFSEVAFYLLFESHVSGNMAFTLEALQEAAGQRLYEGLMTGNFSKCFGYINCNNPSSPNGFSPCWGDVMAKALEELGQDTNDIDPNLYYALTLVDFDTMDKAILFKLEYLGNV